MRKSLIAQSVAAMVAGLCVAGTAHAIGTPGPGNTSYAGGAGAVADAVVNTDGVGHINIVPYYSVQGGTDTYINIVNTDTVNGKAVKVRFRSASNSDDVFDFTLLMSPGDVFAMAVTKVDGVPRVVTSDKTCTLPNNISGRSFVFDRLNPKLTAEQKATEASEGYVELLTMADIPPIKATPEIVTLYESIKHSNGVPLNCNSGAVRALLNDPADDAAANALGLYAPTTGLMTNWTVINVERATSHSGAAAAVEGRGSDGAPAYSNIVFFPQTAEPVTSPATYTSDPILAGGVDKSGNAVTAAVAAAMYDFPDLSTPLVPTTPAAYVSFLTSLLAVTSVTNEYLTDPAIDARTDWVFSAPTRRYATAMAYGKGVDGADLQVFAGGGSLFYTKDNTSVSQGQICVKGIQIGVGGVAVTADREERFAQSDDDFVISPGTPAAPRLFCGEVSVLTFNGKSSLLGAKVAVSDLDTQGFADGWARIGTPGLGYGLPFLGFAASEIVNGDVGGVSANYGLTFPHRVTRPAAP